MPSSPLPPPLRKGIKRPGNARWFLLSLTVVIVTAGTLFFFKDFFMEKTGQAFVPAPRAAASFIPAAWEPKAPNLNLNGIVYDNERPYAIVNNKVMLKGDTIEGAALIEIKQDSVKFVFNDKEFELRSK
jgi:hypothetical protein